MTVHLGEAPAAASVGTFLLMAIDPARTLGPAVGLGRFTGAMPDMAAQFIGATVAALFHRFVFARSIGDENGNAAGAEAAF